MSIFFKETISANQSSTSKATLLSKTMTAVVTAAMINVMTLPAQAAAANQHAKEAYENQHNLIGNNAYDQLVNLSASYQLKQQSYQTQRQQQQASRSLLKKAVDGVTSIFMDESPVIEVIDPDSLTSTVKQLSSLQQQMAEEQDLLNEELENQAQQMQVAGFSQTDLDEHQQLVEQINDRYHQLDDLFNQLDQATDDMGKLTAMTAISEQLQVWQPETTLTDVDNLPWSMPDSKVREPIVNEVDASQAFAQKIHYGVNPDPTFTLQNDRNISSKYSSKYSAIHQSNQSAIGEWRDTEYKFGQMLLDLTSHNGFHKANGFSGSPLNQNSGQWTVLNALSAEVQPADLSETEDVQITQAIKDKAEELEHNPAKIYKWVHDNIVYIPTYGSIQGSDYTLQTKRGNAFDTASLTIALLRASDIPARYVYGTVDVPAKQAMDWVGGVNNIDAAQNLLGQGGVPNVALMDGSVAKHLRLEHIWVEAKINAISKGSANNKAPNNSQNQWIPLDPSYKSYIRTEGIDLAKAVPFDADALIEKAQEGAIIDEATGSVQNLNQGAVNQAIEDYQAQVQEYLEQNHADATVGDVLGTTNIKEYKSEMLSPVLPYQVQTVVSDYQELPDVMKHYFIVNMYQDIYERNNSIALDESPGVHVKIPTTQLQGKPLAMSFKPASAKDEEIIVNALPKPDDNGEIDPSKIPTSFSSGLKMSAEITLNGETLKTGNTYGFGSEVMTQLGYISPNTTGSIQSTIGLANKTIRAGEYHAIGYDMQGLSQQQLENTKNTLETVKNKLEDYKTNQNQAVLDGINKHDVTGAMLQATVQSYFAINDAQDTIAQLQHKNIIQNRYMSFGTFHTFIKPNQRFGLTMGGRMTGMQMDIDRLVTTTVAKDNNHDSLVNFIQSQGPRESANEHLVPEQMFDNPETDEKEVEGISAVKAIQLAQQQGQKIFTITQDNYNEAISQINLSSGAMEDIRNAINAGKTVTTHQNNISYHSWNGSGYIILDPTTGTGAYLIDGGANGAIMIILGSIYVAMAISLIIGLIVFAIEGAAITALTGGLAPAMIGGHIATLLLSGLGLILVGTSLRGNGSEAQCRLGLSLIAGGVASSLSAIVAAALTGGGLSVASASVFTTVETAGLRGGGFMFGFLSSNMCEDVDKND